MRQTSHHQPRNTYHNISSFKIKSPLHEHQPQKNNFTTAKKYRIQQIAIPMTNPNHYHQTSYSHYIEKPKRYHTPYQSKEKIRQNSYTSKGSNVSKNSIKMTELVALQARNLIHNRDKFNYDKQVMNRSSSVHYSCKNQNLSRKHNNQNNNDFSNKKYDQAIQIPSFGVQCRSTFSGGYKNDKISSTANKYPSNSYKLQEPLSSYQGYSRNLQTQIDERIERIRTSSTSNRHKERIGMIKTLDADRIDNMNRINLKIKNILTTLQKQEDHYKQKYIQSSSNKKNSNSQIYTEEKYSQNKYNQLSSKREYQERVQKKARNSAGAFCHDESFIKNSKLGKYAQNHVSSYYYYDDEPAILKSSQSPMNSSPQRYSKNHSPYKYKQNSVDRYLRGSQDIYRYEHKNSQYLATSKLTNQPIYFKQSRYQNKDFYENQRISATILSDIPEYQTQIIESQGHQDFLKQNSPMNIQKYHTFHSNQLNQLKYDKKILADKKVDIKLPKTLNIEISPQKNYKTPQINQLSATSNHYRYEKDQINPKMQKQRQISNENQDLIFEQSNKYSNRLQNSKIAKQNYYQREKMENKNQIYIKKQQKEGFFTTDRIQRLQKELNNQKLKSINDKSISNQIKLFSNRNKSYDQNIKSQNNPRDSHPHKNSFQQSSSKSRLDQYKYPDSIKETFKVEQSQSILNSPISKRKSPANDRDTSFDSKIDSKMKEYEKRIQNYQKNKSASKLIQNQTPTKKIQQFSTKISNQKFSHIEQQKKQIQKKKEQEKTKIQLNIKDQGYSKLKTFNQFSEKLQKSKKQFKTYAQKFNDSIKRNNQINPKQLQTSFEKIETPRKHSPRPSHHFPKDDHNKLIQNLRKQREEVAVLSRSKSRLNNLTSIDLSRLSALQGENSKSISQNSRLSSVTIVKGKNVDEQIERLQKKMQNCSKKKKQLDIQSQNNTQRSKSNKNEMIQQRSLFSSHKSISMEKSQKAEKSVKFELSPPNSLKNFKDKDGLDKSRQLLKIVAYQNSIVKVKKSILKEQKINEIKSYLDGQIRTESNRSRSKTQRILQQISKLSQSSTKQNVLASATKAIDPSQYSQGQRKVMIGLAQNLDVNIDKGRKNNQMNGRIETDVNTPKLLKNLKNKCNDKSIIHKKAEKRGFRSQFINDLHQDNQIITSAKKQSPQKQNNLSNSTSKLRPENQQNLNKILKMIEQQIFLDQKFRNEKKMFNSLTNKEKWSELMNVYVKSVPNQRNISMDEIVRIFTLSQQQNNPFYSTRGVEFSLQSMICSYLECRKHWNTFKNQVSSLSFNQLKQCGINSGSLDHEKKGFIQVDDLMRFVNMELNKYYRRRDVWLIWQRLSRPQNLPTFNYHNERIQFHQFALGIGINEELRQIRNF